MTDLNANEHRRHPRLQHRAKIRVNLLDSSRQIIAEMHNFSEGGLFLLWSDDFGPELENGDRLEVQTTEFDDAPIQTAKVIRVDQGVGVALEFIAADSGADIE